MLRRGTVGTAVGAVVLVMVIAGCGASRHAGGRVPSVPPTGSPSATATTSVEGFTATTPASPNGSSTPTGSANLVPTAAGAVTSTGSGDATSGSVPASDTGPGTSAQPTSTEPPNSSAPPVDQSVTIANLVVDANIGSGQSGDVHVTFTVGGGVARVHYVTSLTGEGGRIEGDWAIAGNGTRTVTESIFQVVAFNRDISLTAFNAAGDRSAAAQADYEVYGDPEAPNVSATSTNGNVTFRWVDGWNGLSVLYYVTITGMPGGPISIVDTPFPEHAGAAGHGATENFGTGVPYTISAYVVDSLGRQGPTSTVSGVS